MTNQIQGEILFAGVNSDPVYTPWMPVRGDFASFGVEVLQNNGTVLSWNVETRTRETVPVTPSDLWTSDKTFSSGSTGISVALADEAATELVRYRFKTGSSASTSNFVVFRALQPSWQVDR